MEEKIAQLKRLAAEKIQQHADTMAALNDVRVEFLGKKGEFTTLLRPGATVLDWGCGTGRDSRRQGRPGGA